MRFLDFRSSIRALGAAALLCMPAMAQKEITFNGGASVSMGRIETSSDTSSFHYSGNRLQTAGAHGNRRR
jgi:hypothetical protein